MPAGAFAIAVDTQAPEGPEAVPGVRPGAGRAVFWIALVALVAGVWVALDRQVTWYLAVDQFGYVTFAEDLLHGRIFHDWPPLRALAPLLASRTDVLAQTYVLDGGRLYSRYAPGFPILLAAWMAMFGESAAHALNPLLFAILLLVLTAFSCRLLGSRWRALAATAILLLAGSRVQLWGITLTRDLACHLIALAGLLPLVPRATRPARARRAAAAGIALGFAGAIRPDAVLYLLPASLLGYAGLRRPGSAPFARATAAFILAFALGLSPLLAFDWLATGNPFLPTQSMEVEQFLSRAESRAIATVASFEPTARDPRRRPRATRRAPWASARAGSSIVRVAAEAPPSAGPVWRGTAGRQVSGGGLRLRSLPVVLPGLLALLRDTYGDFLLGLALLGAVFAALQNRIAFAATVPYIVASLLFYGCWGRAEGRYLFGTHLLLPTLICIGVFAPLDLAERFARTRPSRVLAPAFALALVGGSLWRSAGALAVRATFQQTQAATARDALQAAVAPGSVVIATEDFGRPAENIEHYGGGVRSLYTTDLLRWRLALPGAVAALEGAGVPAFALVSPDWQPDPRLRAADPRLTYELVARIEPADAIRYFVAAAFHRGVPLVLYRLHASAPDSAR